MPATWQQYAERLEWLESDWLQAGPPVCVLSGFAGVGKTILAGELSERVRVPHVYIPVAADGYSLDDLLLTLASDLEHIGLPEVARDQDDDLLASLLKTASTDQLIIIDDFDYLLEKRTGLPPTRFARFLASLKPDFTTKLRLLLISNRLMPEGIWEMDQVVTIGLESPSDREADDFLNELLQRDNMQSELSNSDRRNVVRWLGGNPSALKSLVQCLRFEPIDKLVELDPEGWELKDRVVSPALVKSLERKFLSRCIGHLDQNLKMLVEFLSVYRRPFRSDAIERLDSEIIDIGEATRQLISRYLLSRNRNWYTVNPVVRELCLQSLQNSRRRLDIAYGHAADHYSRHFKQVNSKQSLTSHGTEFVEAKYHLWQAGRFDEFENIAGIFRRQLVRMYGSNNKLPKSPAEREQLLLLLNGALQGFDTGYAMLRWSLARLLLERNKRDDDLLALRQLRICGRESTHIEIWRPLVQLTARLEGARVAETMARQGFEKLVVRSHADLYRAVIEGYEDEDLMPEAIRLVDEGLSMLEIEGQIDLAPTVGRLLAKAGQTSYAIDQLLKIYRAGALSATPLYWRPLEQAIFIAHGKRDVGKLKYIEESLVDTDDNVDTVSLCRCLIHQQTQRYRLAALEAQESAKTSQTVATQVTFSWLCCSELEKAQEVIQSISLPNNVSGIWLLACTYYCLGRTELARECIETLDGDKIYAGEDTDIPARLISIWDDVPTKLGHHPAFYFPILPAWFTGLDSELHRTWGGPSAIAGHDLSRVTLPRRAGSVDDEPQKEWGTHIHVKVGDDVTEYKYNVGQAGAVGDNARAEQVVFFQGSGVPAGIQLADLIPDLERVRSEVHSRQASAEREIALIELDGAIEAAQSGDEQATKSRLRKAGEWTLGIATSIGAGLAIAAIKASIGLS
jgi:hypothetical protein